MSTAFTIRVASVQDAEAISKLGSHIFQTTFGHSCTKQQMDDYLQESLSPAAIAKELHDEKRRWMVAITGDQAIAGYAELNWGSSEPCITHPKAIELQRLYVALDMHGKGVAQQLTKDVEDFSISQGYELMWLGVWEENHKGLRFYEKCGYTKVGEHVFDIGGDLQTDWILQKSLL